MSLNECAHRRAPMSLPSLHVHCKCKSNSKRWRMVVRRKNWIWTKELKIIRSISSFHMHAFPFLLWRLSIQMAHKIIVRLENVEKSEDLRVRGSIFILKMQGRTVKSSTFIIKSTDARTTHEHQNFIPLSSLRCVYSSKLICVKFNYSTPLFDAQLACLHHTVASYHNFLRANTKPTMIKFGFLWGESVVRKWRANISVHYSYRRADATVRHISWKTSNHFILNRKLKKFLIWHFWCASKRNRHSFFLN